MSEPQNIGKTLNRFLEQMGAPPPNTLTSMVDRWPEIVGPALADTTRPIELLDGVLVVACDDATWASQISWMDGQIKRRFGEVFEGAAVRRIQVRIRG